MRSLLLRTSIPKQREFLWHAGSGAIHKGLDLCLEVFAKHPSWTLNITGNLSPEREFVEEYKQELNLPNVNFYGWTIVSSPRFKAILDRCFAFILPSCAEGQSNAVATCLTLGLYPIISRQTGIDLPKGYGLYLDALTIDDVEAKAGNALAMSDAELLKEIKIIQADALWRYSRERFREVMTAHIKEALCMKLSQNSEDLI